MTKEEKLEDEICEYVHNHYKVAALGFSYRDLRDVAEHFALPKEKRIAELEQQIEKMKCCANCEYTPPFDKHCDNCIRGSIKLRYINWQLRR